MKGAEEMDAELVTMPQTPEAVGIPNVTLKSCGELFGKPNAGPVKHHIYREISKVPVEER